MARNRKRLFCGIPVSPTVAWVRNHFFEAQFTAYGHLVRGDWDDQNAQLLLNRFGGSTDRACAWITRVFSSELRRSAGLTLSKLVCWSLTPLEEIDRIVRAWLREKAAGAR